MEKINGVNLQKIVKLINIDLSDTSTIYNNKSNIENMSSFSNQKIDLFNSETFNLLELFKIKSMLDFCDVLLFVHNNNIIHRDLKPNNLMINKNLKCILLDFGISKLADKTKTTYNPRHGTIIYFSPEHVQVGDNETIRISKKTDVWAFGLILNEVFSGEIPWSAYNIVSNMQVLGLLYENKKFIVSKLIKNSDIIRIIKECTKYDKQLRYSTEQVYIHLLIAFFKCLKTINLKNFINVIIEYFDFKRKVPLFGKNKEKSDNKDINYLYKSSKILIIQY